MKLLKFTVQEEKNIFLPCCQAQQIAALAPVISWRTPKDGTSLKKVYAAFHKKVFLRKVECQ